MSNNLDQSHAGQDRDPGWNTLCRLGGVAALVLTLYALETIIQLVILGGQPATAIEAFHALKANRIVGLMRLDFPTILAIPLYYLLFFGLFAALRGAGLAYVTISTAFVFIGVTLVLATPTALSMAALSDKYAAAKTEAARIQLEAVGETILATDIWHGTGAFMGGLLVQSGALLICVLMLRSPVFGKFIAWVGILVHGLDLAHIVAGAFLPSVGVVLMATAGPLYLIWLPLTGRRLLRLGKVSGT